MEENKNDYPNCKLCHWLCRDKYVDKCSAQGYNLAFKVYMSEHCLMLYETTEQYKSRMKKS